MYTHPYSHHIHLGTFMSLNMTYNGCTKYNITVNSEDFLSKTKTYTYASSMTILSSCSNVTNDAVCSSLPPCQSVCSNKTFTFPPTPSPTSDSYTPTPSPAAETGIDDTSTSKFSFSSLPTWIYLVIAAAVALVLGVGSGCGVYFCCLRHYCMRRPQRPAFQVAPIIRPNHFVMIEPSPRVPAGGGYYYPNNMMYSSNDVGESVGGGSVRNVVIPPTPELMAMNEQQLYFFSTQRPRQDQETNL